ncbi:DUF982 domain-containing protein [Phyllobacterium sp. SYP-B3895]|uniref:DUF982 domain-containing protein n=1 Tax=Phyllobacterium sp. SYP-B3895 TaxID=2663240 RepID=UPI001299FCF3|nr:DUF982 domain-containing protein [Phyllobacterium sp. SYP-B3895]
MNDVPFQSLVLRLARRGKPRNVSSVGEALAFLKNDWSHKQGPACLRAKLTCTGALEGHFSPGEARAAFLDALLDAGILVEEGNNTLVERLTNALRAVRE